jgi:glycosyltransferase involved in cell wall biosynthesis
MSIARLCLIVESGTDVRLVEGLAQDFDLTVLARKIEGGVEVSHPPRVAVPVIVGPSSRSGFAAFIARFLWRRRKDTDFVLVQGYALAALVSNLVSLLTTVPTAMLVCSPVEAYYRCRKFQRLGGKPFRRRELWALQLLARLNAQVGQRYIVLSRHLAAAVRSHGTRKPIDVVPVYGVDTRVFLPAAEPKAAVRARLGLPLDGFLVFFSSRVAPEKDAETLLGAMRRLLDAGRNIWLLHRSGGYLAFLEQAQRLGIAQRVIATDAVHPHQQLPLDYQACDLCVQASREEGLGFSPLESLACQVPVVAASVGGLRETIVDGVTGWTYPVGDCVALAKCIRAVCDNPEDAARRTKAGRDLVHAHYDARAVFEQLATIIHRLIS